MLEENKALSRRFIEGYVRGDTDLEDVSKPVRRTSRCGSHPGNSAYR